MRSVDRCLLNSHWPEAVSKWRWNQGESNRRCWKGSWCLFPHILPAEVTKDVVEVEKEGSGKGGGGVAVEVITSSCG